MLKGLGYRADLVCNGVEALQALAKTDYDVVLMDCLMPEMDGYETTRFIREGRSERATLVSLSSLSPPTRWPVTGTDAFKRE